VISLLSSSRPRIYIPIVALLLTALFVGGASRLDEITPLAVTLVAFGCGAFLIWDVPAGFLKIDRGAAWLIGAMLLLPLLQLIPLPFALWSLLPGRGYPVAVYTAIGERPWQPISLTPERTMLSLLGLVPGIVAFVGVSQLDATSRQRLTIILLFAALLAAIFGSLQMAAGSDTGLRFYAITDTSSAVGFFANPNHLAALVSLAAILPFLWLADKFPQRGQIPHAQILAATMAVALLGIGMVLAQARAGAVMFPIAVIVGFTLLPADRLSIPRGRMKLIIPALIVAVILLGVAASYLAPFQQLLDTDESDGRLTDVPRFLAIAAQYFPFGSGLGSFDPVYRMFETPDTLTLNYLNQAHNEPMQVAIETGAAGIALIVAFLAWWSTKVRDMWSEGFAAKTLDTRIRRTGSVITLLLLVHSLVDYPLRTPALAVVFGMACAMMMSAPGTSGARRNRRSSGEALR
jgi:hypothetical protein